MPGLRDILDAAPAGPWRAVPHVARAGMFGGADAFVRAADDKTVATGIRTDRAAELIALAPELAALVLDMGEHIHAYGFGAESDALLSRLSRLGAGDSNPNEKEPSND